MAKKTRLNLKEKRKAGQSVPFSLSALYAVYFLLSFFLPYAYTYRKGTTQLLSGFDRFSFLPAGEYLGRQAKIRISLYVAGGLILLVSVLGFFADGEIKKRAFIILSFLFLFQIGAETYWIIERNVFGNSNVYPHYFCIIQLVITLLCFASYLILLFRLHKGKKMTVAGK